MKRNGTIVLPILIILIVISLSAAAGLGYLYQQERTQNVQLRENIVDLNKRQSLTEEKLEDSKKIATDLQLKLQEAKDKIDSLVEENEKGKTMRAEAMSRLEQFRTDLDKQKSLRQDLENKLSQVQDEGKKIKEELKIIQKQKTELEEKIKNLEAGGEGVELGKVIVNNEVNPNDKSVVVQKAGKKAPAVQAKSLEGKIMVINKEFNFAVINLGSKDKIDIADEFSVLSTSGNPIGDLKVEKVHESMSAAGFSPEIKDIIKENDRIVKKVK